MTAVVVALPGDASEARVVSLLGHPAHRMSVVRRCVDRADLLAVCASGAVGAALVGGPLLRLDRETVARMGALGVGVVGQASDAADAAHLRRLGVRTVVLAQASPAEVVAALRAADRTGGPDPASYSAPGSAGDATIESRRQTSIEPEGRIDDPSGDTASSSPLVAVWGPIGAPGRTSIAVLMAEELARAGRAVRLVDADTYGPSISQVMGLPGDDVPGLAAAARTAHHGKLDHDALLRHLRRVDDGFDVLTGLARADRWPELRPASMEAVLDLLVQQAATTIVDIGFGVENDEELSFDTLAPRRNAAALATIERADVVVAVAAADPVSVRRLVHGLEQLRELVPHHRIEVVLNRVAMRGGARLAADVSELLAEHGHRVQVHPVIDDPKAFTAWRAHGGSFIDLSPRSPARGGVRHLLTALDEAYDYIQAGRWLGRRAG